MFIACAAAMVIAAHRYADDAGLADSSRPVSATRIDPTAGGRLVSLTGLLTASEPLDDGRFLAPGPYLALQRTVEMYAWVEEKLSSADETTDTYIQEWTAAPRSAAGFHVPAGHAKVNLGRRSESLRAPAASIGVYSVSLHGLDLPPMQPLVLGARRLRPDLSPPVAGGRYLFQGHGSPDAPQRGDLRISHAGPPSGLLVTLFGRQRRQRSAPTRLRPDRNSSVPCPATARRRCRASATPIGR